MPTTSNFGWTTPADTDLVKDGAAAIRTLGNGIDTSLVDLKGGTTGQILSKASNTDLDYTWIANDQGDITEVSAGTGISVASGTGPVPVVTNTVATTFDAKGDLVVGTGADTFAKLAVGTNGYTLVADSVETTGLKWVAPSAPAYVGASVSNTASQSIANATEVAITYDTEQWDTDSIHSTVTNTSRLTVPAGKGGKWRLSGFFNGTANGTIWEYYVYVNGAYFITGFPQTSNTANSRGTGMAILNMELNLSASDYVQIYASQTSGGTESVRMQYGRVFFSYIGA